MSVAYYSRISYQGKTKTPDVVKNQSGVFEKGRSVFQAAFNMPYFDLSNFSAA